MGKGKGLVFLMGILVIAIIVSGCGFVEVENSVVSAVSVATDVPQRSLPKANALPITIRSTPVMPKDKVTPVFVFPCPEAVEPFISAYKPLEIFNEPWRDSLKVEVSVIGNQVLAMPITKLIKYSILVAVVYPVGNDYNMDLKSMPRWECGFGKPCTPILQISELKSGDIIEWIEIICGRFDSKTLDCTAGFDVIRVSDPYVYRDGKVNKARVF